MSDELKPCPFCGGEARLDQRVTQSLWNSGDAVFSHVACDECDISGQDFCDDPDGEEAIEWWNRRAQPAEAEGITVVGVVCISHFKNNPAMENVEFHLAADLPQGQHEVIRHSSHLAALSAVTAERDRLRSKWARVESERDRLLSDNASLRGSCKALGEENKQLKRENKRQGRTIAALAAKEA